MGTAEDYVPGSLSGHSWNVRYVNGDVSTPLAGEGLVHAVYMTPSTGIPNVDTMRVVRELGLENDFYLASTLERLMEFKRHNDFEALKAARWYLDYKILRMEESLHGSA